MVIVCGVYPAVLWAIGQTFFPFQANGSIVHGADGKAVGSLLVAQPFTKDEYFQPRPSAASYDASASASSAMRRRTTRCAIASPRALGPIVKYKCGRQEGPTRRAGHRGVVQGRQGRRQAAYRRAMGRRA